MIETHEVAPWIERLTRVGYVAKALLYGTTGARRVQLGRPNNGHARSDGHLLGAPMGRALLAGSPYDIVPNRNSPPAILLRESYREGKKVLKRTIANLSEVPRNIVEGLRILLRGGAAVEHLRIASRSSALSPTGTSRPSSVRFASSSSIRSSPRNRPKNAIG